MSMIKIKSRLHDYEVVFGGCSRRTETYAARKREADCYLVDQKVWTLYRERYFRHIDSSRVVPVEANETNKTLGTVQRFYDSLIRRSAKKNALLISIGGGIIQDVSGFLASTLYRGIRWIYLPTTLLAQADSCIGSKTSLNYKKYKNLIGTFYPPHLVFIDTNFLLTLDEADFNSGLGEVAKLHIMAGPESWRRFIVDLPSLRRSKKGVLAAAIRRSLLIKKSYIEEDEFDRARRNLLNYGHCFGHALEKVSNFRIPHGQAVALGMILANNVSRNRRLLSRAADEEIFEILAPLITVRPFRYLLRTDLIIEAMKKDKKRTGKGLPLISMQADFKLKKYQDLTERETARALNAIARRFRF